MSDSSDYYREQLESAREEQLRREEERDVVRCERDEALADLATARATITHMQTELEFSSSVAMSHAANLTSLRAELCAARLELERLRGEYDKLLLERQQ